MLRRTDHIRWTVLEAPWESLKVDATPHALLCASMTLRSRATPRIIAPHLGRYYMPSDPLSVSEIASQDNHQAALNSHGIGCTLESKRLSPGTEGRKKNFFITRLGK